MNLIVIFLVSVGFASLAYGTFMIWSGLWYLNNGVRVKGRVSHIEVSVANNAGSDSGGAGRTRLPTVSFQTKDGRSISYRSQWGADQGVPNLGADVEVLYDPENPERARLSTPVLLWGPGIFFQIFGLVVLLCLWGYDTGYLR